MEVGDKSDIDKAISILGSRLRGVPIIREFGGYIVLAQSESDYYSKTRRISRGDILGFYTVSMFIEKSKQMPS